MDHARLPPCRTTITALGLLLLPWSLLAQGTPGKPAAEMADAIAACERAAQQSLQNKGAPATELRFSGAPTVQASLSGDSRLVLQGAGSWRAPGGMRKFDYTCDVDLRTPGAVGLVLRDTSPPPPERSPARPAVDPDLSHLSPGACEASAAAALKKRWPRVSEISFDGSNRSLSQESPSKAELHGQGRALPAPGTPHVLFGFDCEIDPRDGRVLGTRISG